MSHDSEADAGAPQPEIDSRQILRLAIERLRRSLRFPGLGRRGLGLIAILGFIAWCSAGIYKVEPDEQGVVLRFGKWVDTQDPGLHYHLPYPIESVLQPKVTKINQLQLGAQEGEFSSRSQAANENQTLTGDENIVEAECTVQWRIKDAGRYLFKVNDPEGLVKAAGESALREVIGRNPIQAALSERRQQISEQTQETLQQLLDTYEAGILVIQVQLARVDPPIAVIDAFNDVQRARADQERARNEAEAYSNDILPRARGEAERITQEAEAYRTQAVNLAEGEAKSFLSIYQTYLKAEDTTAWRLYLDSIDEVLRRASKVIIDSSGKGIAGVVPYLPMSEMKEKQANAPKTSGGVQ